MEYPVSEIQFNQDTSLIEILEGLFAAISQGNKVEYKNTTYYPVSSDKPLKINGKEGYQFSLNCLACPDKTPITICDAVYNVNNLLISGGWHGIENVFGKEEVTVEISSGDATGMFSTYDELLSRSERYLAESTDSVRLDHLQKLKPKKVVIVGNGFSSIEDKEEQATLLKKYRNEENTIFIAVDGGANFLEHCNINPEICVGDFDTIDENLLSRYCSKQSSVIVVPKKHNENEIDLSLAFNQLKKMGEVPSKILVHGCCGKPDRLDVTLANLTTIRDGIGSLPNFDSDTIVALYAKNRYLQVVISNDGPGIELRDNKRNEVLKIFQPLQNKLCIRH
jgi:thiamine pyrophosphokinase